jgi:hypothetical protein
MTDLPIACTLSPSELDARAADLLPGLAADAMTITEISGGVRLGFATSGAVLARLARVIDAERRCCRFLQFTLVVPADEAPLHLDVTGPPGTREFLATLSPAFALAAG